MVTVQIITETARPHHGILSTHRTMTRPNWRDAVQAAEAFAKQQAQIAYRRREGRTVAHVTMTDTRGVTIRHRWNWN